MKFSPRPLLLAVLFCLFALPLAAQKIATEEEITQDVRQVSCKGSAERLRSVVDLFKRMGATDSDLSIVDADGTKNVIVAKKGSGDGFIVVGAHYDKVNDGCGAIDNWTGIVAIAHLYGTLRDYPTTKTFKFVAFDKEEIGLVGSDVFVHQIPKEERSSYCAMVNLDSFGFTQPQVFRQATSDKMEQAANAFWAAEKLKLGSASIANADADSTSFIKAGIPAITFSGLNDRWEQYLHTAQDRLENVNTQSVWLGYRTILPFIVDIDKKPCTAFRRGTK